MITSRGEAGPGCHQLLTNMGESELTLPEGEQGGENEEGGLQPLFRLGQIVGTPGALDALAAAEQQPLELLARHVTGDWGEVPEEDKEANDKAVEQGFRILSAYQLRTGVKVWLITEWDRSVTTILKPSEY